MQISMEYACHLTIRLAYLYIYISGTFARTIRKLVISTDHFYHKVDRIMHTNAELVSTCHLLYKYKYSNIDNPLCIKHNALHIKSEIFTNYVRNK